MGPWDILVSHLFLQKLQTDKPLPLKRGEEKQHKGTFFSHTTTFIRMPDVVNSKLITKVKEYLSGQ